MKIRTVELTGAALDWAVEDAEFCRQLEEGTPVKECVMRNHDAGLVTHKVTADDLLNLIDRERITIHCFDGLWMGFIFERNSFGLPVRRDVPRKGLFGDFVTVARSIGCDPLEATKRCYVASKRGDKVDVPDALL